MQSDSTLTPEPAPSPPGPAKKRTWRILAAATLTLVAVTGGVWGTAHVLQKSAEPTSITADGIRTWDELGREHTTDDVDYPMHPPVGGDHDPIWLKCQGTVYGKEVRNESAVHSLEHGAVWVTYNDDAPEKDIGTLKKLVTSTDYTLMSPYESQQAPITLSAWGHQLDVDTADDPRVKDFFDTYVQGPQTPEPYASCEGGHMRKAPSK